MIDTKAIRTKILDLAFQGKLTDQRAEEGTGETLYVDIQAGKKKQVQWPDVDLKKIPSHIPDSWKWVHMNHIAVSSLGKTMDKSKNTGDICYFAFR